MVADLLQLDKFVLGGMSMGGYISLRFALSHSERLSGLILMATQAEQDPPEIASSYMELCDGWQDPIIKENIISSLLPVFSEIIFLKQRHGDKYGWAISLKTSEMP